MDNKNYRIDSVDESSTLKDDSGVVYSTADAIRQQGIDLLYSITDVGVLEKMVNILKTNFGLGASEMRSITAEEYKQVFSPESRIESIIESESQIASKTYEAMDETEFIKRMSERFPWITA